ncbi:hypothetical protein ACIQU6_42285 [Streptomyces sp. NPDC090442]|uniref:hypothetical protein n=1 Tax=Streptomyces sp. NPDC090442 TaxID=3365962 RepID=UPI00382912F4
MAEYGTTPQDTARSSATGNEEACTAPFRAPRAARFTTAVAAAHLAPVKRSAEAAASVNPWIP